MIGLHGNTSIGSLSYGPVFKYNSGYTTKWISSDTFCSTWADDGNIYTIHDDTNNGGTWQGISPTCNTAVSKLSTFDTTMTGSIVNTMQGFGPSTTLGSDGASWKGNSIISVNGVLYEFVSRQIYGTAGSVWRQSAFGGQLLKSSDHGVTFTPQPPSTSQPFTSPMFSGATFAAPVFVQYGQDYQGNTVHNSNLYVYAISNNGFWNNGDALYLGRCLISAIGNQSGADWSFYTGGDGMLDVNWSTTWASASPLVSKTKSLGLTGAQYLPAFKQYVMFGWYYPSIVTGPTIDTTTTIWDVYTSDTPWGPWYVKQSNTWHNPGGGVGLYNPNIIPKSVSVDGGRTLWIATAGDYFAEDPATGDYTLTLVPVTVNN